VSFGLLARPRSVVSPSSLRLNRHGIARTWRLAVGEDDAVSRRSWWWALVLGAGLAAAGAGLAYVLAGGPWAAAGAVTGAVAGAFGPSVYDGVRARGARHEARPLVTEVNGTLMARRSLHRLRYDLGSTVRATTQRCMPIVRSRVNPSFS
jgi:hypothetical protein